MQSNVTDLITYQNFKHIHNLMNSYMLPNTHQTNTNTLHN